MQAACVGTFSNDGLLTDRAWSNPYQNFDNVGNALLSLFVAVTLNGYSRKYCILYCSVLQRFSAVTEMACLLRPYNCNVHLCNALSHDYSTA